MWEAFRNKGCGKIPTGTYAKEASAHSQGSPASPLLHPEQLVLTISGHSAAWLLSWCCVILLSRPRWTSVCLCSCCWGFFLLFLYKVWVKPCLAERADEGSLWGYPQNHDLIWWVLGMCQVAGEEDSQPGIGDRSLSVVLTDSHQGKSLDLSSGSQSGRRWRRPVSPLE